MTATQTGTAATRPDALYFGMEAAAAYEQARTEWKEASDRALEVRAVLPEARQDVDDLADEMLVNGGTEEHPIDGGNDTKRKAQLAVALMNDNRYQHALGNLRDIESDLRVAESEMQDAEHRMRGARLRLEWATAWLHRLAGAGTDI